MIGFFQILSKLWNTESDLRSAQSPINLEEIEYQDFQILEWRNTLPESLKLFDAETGDEKPSPDRRTRRLRSLLYIRANTARIIIHRRVILNPANMIEYRTYAETAVDIAKDSIRFLSHLYATTDIHHTQQTCFSVIASLSTLLLAIINAPAIFHESCRADFYTALQLLAAVPPTASVAARLQRITKGLKALSPTTKRVPLLNPLEQAHETAAVAMAKLANRPFDSQLIMRDSIDPRLQDKSHIIQELTDFYEMIGRTTSTAGDVQNLPISIQEEEEEEEEDISGINSVDQDEFDRMIKELFVMR
jgi:hypothetical protein